MEIPERLEHLQKTAAGRQWLGTLPGAVEACVAQWSLQLEDPFPDSYVSLTVPGRDDADTSVVLKIQFPHRENETEALALTAWAGNGAVLLLDEYPEHQALLLERCEPGEPLARHGIEYAIDVIVGLLPRLWVPGGERIGSLRDEVARWIDNLPVEWEAAGRPFARSLLDEAMGTLAYLATSQGDQVLVNQDLHGWNILTAQREPWLVIDPKPLVGEREFGVSSVIRAEELGGTRADTMYRLDRLTDELGLDRERSRLWAFGHAIAWSFEDGSALPHHIETTNWLRPR